MELGSISYNIEKVYKEIKRISFDLEEIKPCINKEVLKSHQSKTSKNFFQNKFYKEKRIKYLKKKFLNNNKKNLSIYEDLDLKFKLEEIENFINNLKKFKYDAKNLFLDVEQTINYCRKGGKENKISYKKLKENYRKYLNKNLEIDDRFNIENYFLKNNYIYDYMYGDDHIDKYDKKLKNVFI